MNLKLYAVFHDLSGKRCLELINGKLSRPIGRSTYYNHKKKLYEDEKYQSLKKSIYKSKLLKCFLLYLDGSDEPDGFDILKHISEQFPEKKSIFHVTKEQRDELDRIHNRVKSNFCLRDLNNDSGCSNLTRMNLLPRNYILREEYIRCGKDKMNK